MRVQAESLIRGSLDDIRRRIETPAQRAQWDLRLTFIVHLVDGMSETAAEQTVRGVRVITRVEYAVRQGVIGRAIDRALVRPAIGWAAAWSLDRLRLWIEDGIEPRDAARRALIHLLCGATVAFVWCWHGLVPKLLGPHPDELSILIGAGMPAGWAPAAVQIIGVAELAFGLAFLPLARRRWPWLLSIALMVGAAAGVLVTSPHWARAAFGPVTVNLQLAVLAIIGLLTRRNLPSARRSVRSASGA